MELPLVSCLCITYNKHQKLTSAIESFIAQTYPKKELIIIYSSYDKRTTELLKNERFRNDETIIAIEQEGHEKLTIGELRNISIEACKGQYFCTWDDDDWYHEDRIKSQVSYLQETFQTACMLSNVLIYDERTNKAYLSSFRLWENSLLTKKGKAGWQPRYPKLPRHEDSFFVNALIAQEHVIPLIKPYLYIYTVSGANTSSSQHFERIIKHSQFLGEEISEKIKAITSRAVTHQEGSGYLNSESFLSSLKLVQHSNLSLSDAQLIELNRKKRLSIAHQIVKRASIFFNKLEHQLRSKAYQRRELDTDEIRELLDI